MDKTHKKATDDKAKATPLTLEIMTDDALGYCDPETGVCTVPAPLTKTGKEASPTSNQQAPKTHPSH